MSTTVFAAPFNSSIYLFVFKDSILLRTAKDPNYVVNWEKFGNEDRNKLQDTYVNENTKVNKVLFIYSNVN